MARERRDFSWRKNGQVGGSRAELCLSWWWEHLSLAVTSGSWQWFGGFGCLQPKLLNQWWLWRPHLQFNVTTCVLPSFSCHQLAQPWFICSSLVWPLGKEREVGRVILGKLQEIQSGLWGGQGGRSLWCCWEVQMCSVNQPLQEILEHRSYSLRVCKLWEGSVDGKKKEEKEKSLFWINCLSFGISRPGIRSQFGNQRGLSLPSSNLINSVMLNTFSIWAPLRVLPSSQGSSTHLKSISVSS